jgi:hypothetical protein
MKHSSLIPVERIEKAIYLIRGEKVMRWIAISQSFTRSKHEYSIRP